MRFLIFFELLALRDMQIITYIIFYLLLFSLRLAFVGTGVNLIRQGIIVRWLCLLQRLQINLNLSIASNTS